jgi:hypothetical protein
VVDPQAELIRNVEQIHRQCSEVTMLEKFKLGLGDMPLAIVIWLCSLSLVGLLVIPLFGLKVGLVAAAALFIAVIVICWGICGWKVFRE